MNAPNLVYATVSGRYPRLLADDGVHEPLVLPYNLDAYVIFDFYPEGSRDAILYLFLTAAYLRPDGSTETLQVGANLEVRFQADMPAGGLCVLQITGTDLTQYQSYPFRVLRPTEGLTP